MQFVPRWSDSGTVAIKGFLVFKIVTRAGVLKKSVVIGTPVIYKNKHIQSVCENALWYNKQFNIVLTTSTCVVAHLKTWTQLKLIIPHITISETLPINSPKLSTVLILAQSAPEK